nr:unnamed protein product [Callosobruchus analis]
MVGHSKKKRRKRDVCNGFRIFAEHNASKIDNSFKRAASTKDILLITLRYLATDDSYPSLKRLFIISTATICYILREFFICAFHFNFRQYAKLNRHTPNGFACTK